MTTTAVPSGSPLETPLLPLVASGRPGAVDDVLTRYAPLVWSIARRLAPSDTDAEEAVQEVFVDLWRSAPRFDPAVASERAFVAMITRRRVTDRLRKHYRNRSRSVESIDAVSEPPRPAPARDLASADDARQALDAFASLRDEQRQVLRLSIQQGLTHEEISTALAMPLGTVKTHARRGLMQIRALLGDTAGLGSAS